MTNKRVDHRHLTSYGRNVQSLNRNTGGYLAVAEEHRAFEADVDNTLRKATERQLTPIGDKLSMHETEKKEYMSLTPNEGVNKCFATPKSDERAAEGNAENTEAKCPLL